MRLLVVNSAHFPGWQAEIGGRRAEILRANALVQGVVLPPGRQRVRLTYRPASFRLGVTLSLAALAGLAIAVVSVRRRRPD
ncbi:MAG: YfhO family protein [Candidatus Binatia bacterium]